MYDCLYMNTFPNEHSLLVKWSLIYCIFEFVYPVHVELWYEYLVFFNDTIVSMMVYMMCKQFSFFKENVFYTT